MFATCKICYSSANPFSTAKLLEKYDIQYFKCENCGFLQTEEPHWLKEAYAQAINRNDVGLVDRNIHLAKISKATISVFFNQDGKFIDYGGGFGLFVRLMRDAGFDFYRHDKYCENIFAQDFEAELGKDNAYELLTAFEVFEHLVNPLEEIEQMFALSKNILFTTEIIPANNPKPGEWWYYGLDHGQHISFYSLRSLSILAEKMDLRLYSDGRSLHLLTPKKSSPFLFRLVINSNIATIINRIYRRTSFIPLDCK